MGDYVEGAMMAPDATVTYGRADDTDLQMDIWHARQGVGLRPAVVFYHGGGWSGGNRRQFHWHAAQLARLGYFTASVSYRLSGDASYPAQIDDSQLAIRYLRSHGHEFSLDGERIGVVGSSAGGHLVALLGVRDTRDADAALPDVSSRVPFVIDVHGAHDLTCYTSHSLLPAVEKLMGGPMAGNEDQWQDASPMHHVDEHAAEMMLLHDPGDPTVPYEESVIFADALIRAGRSVDFLVTPGAGHGYVYNPSNEWTRRVWPSMVRWLDAKLDPSR